MCVCVCVCSTFVWQNYTFRCNYSVIPAFQHYQYIRPEWAILSSVYNLLLTCLFHVVSFSCGSSMWRLAGIIFTDLTRCATGHCRLGGKFKPPNVSCLIAFQDRCLCLCCPRSIRLEWLHSHFLHLLLRLATSWLHLVPPTGSPEWVSSSSLRSTSLHWSVRALRSCSLPPPRFPEDLMVCSPPHLFLTDGMLDEC